MWYGLLSAVWQGLHKVRTLRKSSVEPLCPAERLSAKSIPLILLRERREPLDVLFSDENLMLLHRSCLSLSGCAICPPSDEIASEYNRHDRRPAGWCEGRSEFPSPALFTFQSRCSLARSLFLFFHFFTSNWRTLRVYGYQQRHTDTKHKSTGKTQKAVGSVLSARKMDCGGGV